MATKVQTKNQPMPLLLWVSILSMLLVCILYLFAEFRLNNTIYFAQKDAIPLTLFVIPFIFLFLSFIVKSSLRITFQTISTAFALIFVFITLFLSLFMFLFSFVS
jgi:hypothetical protein